MAHIQKRGPGRYRVRYVDPDGHERSKTFERKVDAQTFLTSVSHQVLAGTYVDSAAGKVTLRVYAETWRTQQIHRPKSAASIETRFRRHVYPVLGDRALASIRPSDIRAWQAGALQSLAPSTVKGIRGQLSAMFKAAMVDRRIVANPVDPIRAPRVERALIRPLTVEQVRLLEAGMRDTDRRSGDYRQSLRYRAVVQLVADSGLRAGEVFGLTVDRVDFLRRTVTVDRQLVGRARGGAPIFGPVKTPSSNRVVPLAQVTLDALALHLQRYPAQGHELVFRTVRGGAVTRGVFGRVWGTAQAEAGLAPGDGLHQLRHFYASLLIAHGASVKEVQARLGHKSAVETLDTYAHLGPDSADSTRAAVERVREPVQTASRRPDDISDRR